MFFSSLPHTLQGWLRSGRARLVSMVASMLGRWHGAQLDGWRMMTLPHRPVSSSTPDLRTPTTRRM